MKSPMEQVRDEGKKKKNYRGNVRSQAQGESVDFPQGKKCFKGTGEKELL